MNNLSKYIPAFLSVLVFTVIISCDRETSNKDTTGEGFTTTIIKEPIVLDQLSNRKSDLNNTPEPSIYTSKFDAKIGELVDLDITTLNTSKLTTALSNSTIDRKSFITHSYSLYEKQERNVYSFLNVIFDNDIFNNTDYYYTNGINIQYFSPFFSTSPISKLLVGLKNADLNYYGLSIKQNIYTPTNPDISEVIVGDRPFAAFLTMGTKRASYDIKRKISLSSELNIGVLGPAALGGKVQSTIHNIEPVGWENQIRNSLVVDYAVMLEKSIISSPHFETNLTAIVNVGTVFNKIEGGFYARTGSFIPVYRGLVNSRTFQYWFFIRGGSCLVLHDATLQGGIFNGDNIYTIHGSQLNRIVLNGSAGMALYYNGLGLEIENFYVSPEFKGAYDFRWGRIKLIINI